MNYFKWFFLFLIIYLLHLYFLLHTTFMFWQEMIMYPWLIQKGLVYLKDWIAWYTPAGPYFLSVLYNYFGYSYSSLKIIAYLIISLFDILFFLVSIKLFKKRSLVFLTFIFFVIWHLILEGNTLWFDSLVIPLLLAEFYFLINYLENKRARSIIAASIFVSIAILFKQVVLWNLIATYIFLLIYFRRDLMKTVQISLTMLGIPFISLISLSIYYYHSGIFNNFFYWAVLFPLSARNAPYYALSPSPPDLKIVAPVYFVVLLLIAFLFIYRNSYKKNTTAWLSIVFTLSLAMFAYPRWGIFHLVPSLVFASLTVGFLFDFFSTFKFGSKILFGIMFGLYFILSVQVILYVINVRFKNYAIYSDTEIKNLSEIVRKVTINSDFYIFGNYDLLYYYLNIKPKVTPWIQLFPAIAEADSVQSLIITSLNINKVHYVIYFPYHEDKAFYADYVPEELWRYIFSNYHKVSPLPHHGWILKRNDL